MYEELTALASTIAGAAPDAPRPTTAAPPARARAPRGGRGPFADAVTVGGGVVATMPGGVEPGVAVFPQAPDAMTCALTLAEQHQGRSGLYKGETRRRGDAVDGPAIDAARSLHELSTGGIVLTARVAGLVSHLLAGAVVADRGAHRTAPGRLERRLRGLAAELAPRRRRPGRQPRLGLAPARRHGGPRRPPRLPSSTPGRPPGPSRARSASSPSAASRASARRPWRPSWPCGPTPRAPRSSTAAGTRAASPTTPAWRAPSTATSPSARRASSPATWPGTATSPPGSSPASATLARRWSATPPPSSGAWPRRSPPGWPAWPPAGPSWWCSTTSSGPTPRRWPCSSRSSRPSTPGS